MKWFLEQTINAEDLLLNNNTDCTVSLEIPEVDDSDIIKANSLPSVPDPEFCVRTANTAGKLVCKNAQLNFGENINSGMLQKIYWIYIFWNLQPISDTLK